MRVLSATLRSMQYDVGGEIGRPYVRRPRQRGDSGGVVEGDLQLDRRCQHRIDRVVPFAIMATGTQQEEEGEQANWLGEAGWFMAWSF